MPFRIHPYHQHPVISRQMNPVRYIRRNVKGRNGFPAFPLRTVKLKSRRFAETELRVMMTVHRGFPVAPLED